MASRSASASSSSTAHDSAYRAALDLNGSGRRRRADRRSARRGRRAAARRRARGRDSRSRPRPSMHAVAGPLARRRPCGSPRIPGGMRTIACDALLMSGGWTPSRASLLAIARQARVRRGARRSSCRARRRSASAPPAPATATSGCAEALAEGDAAGRAAATAAGFAAPDAARLRASRARRTPAGGIARRAAARARRPTRQGLRRFPERRLRQGRRARGPGGHALDRAHQALHHDRHGDRPGQDLEHERARRSPPPRWQKPIPEVGLTTFRPPYTPVTFGAFAGPARGDLFDPVRTTPIHDWAAEHGAVFEDVGAVEARLVFSAARRGRCTPPSRANAATTRAAVGLFDASTLGKIEVVGPDAADIPRTHVRQRLPEARGRALPLRPDAERGRLHHGRRRDRAASRPTASTSRRRPAARRACSPRWRTISRPSSPDLEVWLTSTTEQWAAIAVQGPRARETIAPLVEGIDLSRRRHAAHERARGADLRRADAADARQLHRRTRLRDQRRLRITAATSGRPCGAEAEKHGGCAYGTEAMHVLRAEKGYVIVGQETDGTVTPADLGLDWAIGKTKRRLRRQALAGAARYRSRDGRKQLVGLLTDDPAIVLEEGAQVTESADAAASARRRSATSPRPIAARRSAARSRSRWSPRAARAWARSCYVSMPAAAPSP